jgi:hypothetical protein
MTNYLVQNQWGGNNAPWNSAGLWVLGSRANQSVVSIDISSKDNGKTFIGTITYTGEGPIGFKAVQRVGNNYNVQNQWGGDNAPWHDGGVWIIGDRDNQRVVSLKVVSTNGGKTLAGQNTYQNEGPIGFTGTAEF